MDDLCIKYVSKGNICKKTNLVINFFNCGSRNPSLEYFEFFSRYPDEFNFSLFSSYLVMIKFHEFFKSYFSEK